jgi:hypothetical protein
MLISFRLWESMGKNPGSLCSCLSAWTPTVKVPVLHMFANVCHLFDFSIKSNKIAGNFW